MTRITRLGLACSFILAGSLLFYGIASADRPAASVTFTKDVAPIIFNNCSTCHRPGEIGPMSLLSYKEVRPWAKSIREVVVERRMPPWGADPHYGDFSNDRRLSDKNIDTIVAWVEGGVKEGDPKDLPPAPKFVDGWNIGKPDAIFSMPEEFSVPADGVVDYQNYTVPTNFTEDKYVQAAEIRVGNRSVVHHAVVFILEPGRVRGQARSQTDPGHSQEHRLAGYTPGQGALVLRPGVTKIIKKGASLHFNLHYTPNGAPAKDRTSVGIVFAKGPVQRRLGTAMAATGSIDIPPGEPNYELKASLAFKDDSHIETLRPHMHARGKDILYRLVYPDGTSKTLLWVPRYDFNWQMYYVLREPLAVPKGSRVECVAHYDNSARNKFNPDPTQRVRFGEQTWDEMLAGYVEYTVDSEDLRPESARLGQTASK